MIKGSSTVKLAFNTLVKLSGWCGLGKTMLSRCCVYAVGW